MKKLYEKNEVTFAVVWIIIYCVVQSLAMNLNELTGVDYSVSAVLCAVQAVILFLFVKKNGLTEKYGLCKPKASAKQLLFCIPLLILVFGHIWSGAPLGNYPPAELA
ncbi:MAG: CPBP family intramembrane metalloprotease, partial [Oscillospiraceae bacterium]|nr:CPBP family intramembrane metalloprotease [Oscillospiraceae bacterium]